MITRGDRSTAELGVPTAAASLPPAPPSVDVPPFASGPPRTRGRRRVVTLSLAAAVGVAVGLGLGALVPTTAAPTEVRDGRSLVLASGGSASVSERGGFDRADRVIAAVLAAAPRCTPDIRMAGAPVAERSGFLEEARRLAAEASDAQGLRSVRWRVIERDGRLFGVLYGERCE